MDVFRREEGGGSGTKCSMFVEVEGTTAQLTARFILLRKKSKALEREKENGKVVRWESKRQSRCKVNEPHCLCWK